MSLILKGIGLPKDGETCYLAISKNASRYVLYEAIDGDFEKLIEARGIEAIQIERPHGRLIDGDELRAEFRDMAEMEWNKKTMPLSWSYAYEDAINEIDLVPTILEAEE